MRARLIATAGESQRKGGQSRDVVDADAEIIMFSPQHKHTAVIDHMIEGEGLGRRRVGGGGLDALLQT